MVNLSPSSAIQVSLGTYSLLRFGESPEQWAQLGAAVDAAFGGPSLRCMKRVLSRTLRHSRAIALRAFHWRGQ
jgi:hypothetical protein